MSTISPTPRIAPATPSAIGSQSPMTWESAVTPIAMISVPATIPTETRRAAFRIVTSSRSVPVNCTWKRWPGRVPAMRSIASASRVRRNFAF